MQALTYVEADRQRAHCVTSGLSRLPVRALHPTELACTVHQDQAGAALFLLESIARIATERGGTLTLGSTIGNATPLLARTAIHGVLLTTSLRFEDLDVVHAADGSIALHVLTVLPLTDVELDFVQRRGADALEQVIDGTMVDVTDVRRGSMVPPPTAG